MAKPLTPWTRAPLTPETSEFAHQSALFMWAKMAERFGWQIANEQAAWQMPFVGVQTDYGNLIKPMPQLKWFHAIKNQGHGDAVRGNQSRAEGVKAGVLDCFLPVPVDTLVPWRSSNYPFPGGYCTTYQTGDEELSYHGLYLEMKRISGKSSEKQDEFISDMQSEGYACAIAEGWIAGRDVLLKYLLTT